MAQKASPVDIIIFISLAFVWGSSFILMKYGLISFSYMQIGALRISLAFLFTALLGFRYFKLLNRDNWFALAVVGLFGNGIPYMLFPLAITRLDSSLVGVLNSLVPLFTLVVGIFWFKLSIRLASVIGIILGLLGAMWLMLPDIKLDTSNLLYGAYPIFSTICYAISINTINSKLKDLKALPITLLSLLFVGVPAIIYLSLTDFYQIMAEGGIAWRSFLYVAVLGIVGSSLAIIGFNYLIKNTTSLFAASVTYVVPIIAILWGVLDGEDIGVNDIFGMAAILLGVYLVNKRGSLAERIRRKKEKIKKPL